MVTEDSSRDRSPYSYTVPCPRYKTVQDALRGGGGPPSDSGHSDRPPRRPPHRGHHPSGDPPGGGGGPPHHNDSRGNHTPGYDSYPGGGGDSPPYGFLNINNVSKLKSYVGMTWGGRNKSA